MTRVAGCYAALLDDCEGSLSGEHYTSRSLLERLARGEKAVSTEGPPWLKGQRKMIGIANLKANILCERHNRLLSPLDSEIVKFLDVLDTHAEGLLYGRLKESQIVRIDGDKVERWLAKTFYGHMVSDNLHIGGRLVRGTPGLEELQFVFDRPNNYPAVQWYRLWVHQAPGSMPLSERASRFTFLHDTMNPGNGVVGAEWVIAGLRFWAFRNAQSVTYMAMAYPKAVLRPAKILFQHKEARGKMVEMQLVYRDGPTSGDMGFEIGSPYPTESAK